MIAKKVLISGLVQGVGFRYWASQRAEALGLAGWVRNRRDGSVEALVYGETDAVEEFVRACRLGPRHCRSSRAFSTSRRSDAGGPVPMGGWGGGEPPLRQSRSGVRFAPMAVIRPP